MSSSTKTSNAAVEKWNGTALVVFDAALFVAGCMALYFSRTFPPFAIFWVTVSLGAFVIILTTVLQYWMSERTRSFREKKTNQNIVPGYCPDYWTKAFDDKGNVVCNNGFSFQDANGETTTYKFSDPKVPATIQLNGIKDSTNANKCATSGSVTNFPAPWMEIKAKCSSVSF